MQINGFPRTLAMYVDESGDAGTYIPSALNSRHYILSGVIIPVDRWKGIFDQHRQIRFLLKQTYGLPVRDEIHTADWLGRNRSKQAFPAGLSTKFQRVQALRSYVERVSLDLVDIQFIHVHVNKTIYIMGIVHIT